MMTHTTKTIALIVCALILTAAVLFCLRDVVSFSGYSYAESEKYSAGEAKLSEPVRNLDIRWTSGKVNVAYHSENTVLVSETSNRPISEDGQLRWMLDGDTLRIQYAKAGFRQTGWNMHKELTVTLPEDAALNDVSISATSADLSVPSLKAESVALNTTSGDIAAAAEARSILSASTSGDLFLTLSGNAGDVRATSTSGSIRIEAAAAERLQTVSTSGSIEVTAKAVGTLEASSTSGTILADVQRLPGGQLSSTSGSITVSAEEVSTLKVNAVSGSVSARLPAEPGFTASVKTVSGSFEYTVPMTRSSSARSEYICGDGSGRVEISTTSGNIRIDGLR